MANREPSGGPNPGKIWAVFFILLLMVAVSWFISQPIVFSILTTTRTTARTLDVNTTGYENMVSFLLVLNNFWPGILIVIMLVWAIINSQAEDPRSGIYR